MVCDVKMKKEKRRKKNRKRIARTRKPEAEERSYIIPGKGCLPVVSEEEHHHHHHRLKFHI